MPVFARQNFELNMLLVVEVSYNDTSSGQESFPSDIKPSWISCTKDAN